MNLKILILAVLSEIMWLTTLAFLPWNTHIEMFLMLFGSACVIYFFGVRVVLSHEVSGRLAFLILGAGLVFRATAFFAPPTLSDDIYRYLWDGRVQLAGDNPYRVPPDNPALESLRTTEWENINHKHIRTIYPPLAQVTFAAGAFVRPTINTQKIIFIFFDVLTCVFLAMLLKRKNLSPARVLIYSWHPLVITEFSSSGHLDSLAISAMVAGFLLIEYDRLKMSGAIWALGFLAKLGTGLMLPWMVFSRTGRRLLVPFIAMVLLGYGCYALTPLGEWKNFFSASAIYASTWSFNAALFEFFMKLSFLSSSTWRLLSGLVGGGLAIWFALKTKIAPLAHMGLLLSAVLLLSPVVYPWYVVWLVPFLCFYPVKAGFGFTTLVALSYLVLPRFENGLGWTLPSWVLLVEYGVPAVFLGIEARKSR